MECFSLSLGLNNLSFINLFWHTQQLLYVIKWTLKATSRLYQALKYKRTKCSHYNSSVLHINVLSKKKFACFFFAADNDDYKYAPTLPLTFCHHILLLSSSESQCDVSMSPINKAILMLNPFDICANISSRCHSHNHRDNLQTFFWRKLFHFCFVCLDTN